MKRLLAFALTLSMFTMTAGLFTVTAVGLVGCGEETKKEEKKVESGPGGTRTQTVTEKEKVTGDNPPPKTTP